MDGVRHVGGLAIFSLSVSGVCGCSTLTKPISPDTAFAKLFHRQRGR
jgi:hypothetical protein